jgi:hypothetical protein
MEYSRPCRQRHRGRLGSKETSSVAPFTAACIASVLFHSKASFLDWCEGTSATKVQSTWGGILACLTATVALPALITANGTRKQHASGAPTLTRQLLFGETSQGQLAGTIFRSAGAMVRIITGTSASESKRTCNLSSSEPGGRVPSGNGSSPA